MPVHDGGETPSRRKKPQWTLPFRVAPQARYTSAWEAAQLPARKPSKKRRQAEAQLALPLYGPLPGGEGKGEDGEGDV